MTMTEEAPAAAAAAPAPEKKGKGKIIILGVLVVVALAAGYMVGGGGGGDAAAEGEPVEPEIVEGALVGIEPMTLNLADGRYLRIGVSFQMTDQYESGAEEGGHAEGGGATMPAHDASKVQDLLISMFAGRSASELTDAGGRDLVKLDLHHRTNEMFEDQVMEVFFTTFVIQ